MGDVDIDVQQLASWLWCLHTPLVQAYAVRDHDGFSLIDTGVAGGGEALLRALAQIDGRREGEVALHDIVITHAHDDHAGAAAELAARTGARVLASEGDADVIEGSREAPPPQLADWEVPLYEQVRPHVPPAPAVSVHLRLQEGDELPWSEPAHVLAAPGHTPGSIAVVFPRARVLVAGDSIASHEGDPMLGVFNSDPSVAAESFRRLAGLDVELACFGHGPPVVADARRALARVANASR